jgi:hypothetical protein
MEYIAGGMAFIAGAMGSVAGGMRFISDAMGSVGWVNKPLTIVFSIK